MIALGRSLRRRFLLEPGTAFLNHGSFGATPREVLAAAQRWRVRMEANPDRFLRYVMPGALRKSAATLAEFLKAKEKDLAFVENATSGVNAVLRSLEFRPGDEILSTTHTYNAVRQTIRHVCLRSGAKSVEVPISLPVESSASLERSIRSKFTKSTRLLVLDHISSPTGLIFPVKRIAQFARARGTRVLVDGAHAPGQLDLDIPSLGVDWYAGNCHKWLFAPKGCGFLWANGGPRSGAAGNAQTGIHPPVISHGYEKGFAAEFDWTGTRDFSAWLSVPDALGFLKELNPVKVRAYSHRLVTEAASEIAQAWNTRVDGPPALHGSMMAIRLPERLQRRDPRQLVQEWVTRHRIVAPVMSVEGTLWVRISAQVYNVAEDYEKLATCRSIP